MRELPAVAGQPTANARAFPAKIIAPAVGAETFANPRRALAVTVEKFATATCQFPASARAVLADLIKPPVTPLKLANNGKNFANNAPYHPVNA